MSPITAKPHRMSARPDLSSLLASRPSSPGPSPKSPKKGVSFEDKEKKAFEKAAARPLTKEATAHVMDSMGEALQNPDKLAGSLADNAKLYWKIQAYKRAFKDRLAFNNRVSRESPTSALSKELESIESQLNARNGHAAMEQLFSIGGDVLGMAFSTYNPTSYDVTNLPQKWNKAMAEGYWEDEIVELSIKWGDWLSQGPEMRTLIKAINLLRVLDSENRIRTAGADENMRKPASSRVTANPAFADL